jgi:hypothetical protein
MRAQQPSAELYRYTYIHEGISAVMDALTELAARMSVASAIAKRAPEGEFTPRDVEDLITATSEVQGRLEFVTSLSTAREDWPEQGMAVAVFGGLIHPGQIAATRHSPFWVNGSTPA